ncbi:hypothetical protein B566_EDAN006342 [Ephemera danica]|nr:hypothetical protein B566_EDAN006342 [Ephemera danica]
MGNCFRRSDGAGEESRRLWVNCEDLPEATMAQNNYPDNRVITSRYTFITFVPFNLFEQFRRIANFYFLCMVIIQLSIDSPVSVTTSALPLVFVVSVTAVKQGYEDWLRHRGDRAVNNAMVHVVRRGCLQEVQSREVRVGEVLKLFENQPVPCDVLLLCSSDPDHLCHVTTANLDGETNLKTLRCPKILRTVGPEQLNRFRARIECDPPTSNLYTFHGKLEVLPDGPGPGILEPGSVGPAGNSSPVPERLTHRRVKSLGTVSENASNGQKTRPISIQLTELTSQNRRESLGNASPVMSRLGSLKRWSMRRFSSKRSPPTMIQVSTEMTEALDAENLLLRGATIRNTEYVYGCAIYTGQQTKLALNSRITRNKFSTIEKTVNKFLIFYLMLLFVEVAICSGLKYGFEAGDWFKTLSYLPPREDVTVGLVLQDVFSFVVLFNYIIPISLYVTMELQKFLGSLFFVWDVEMYSAELDEHAIANTSDLNEELGQVQYLFTDKTGTLTENDMVFRRCSVDGKCYEERSGHLLLLGPDGDPRRSLRTLTQLPPDVETFYLAVAVCHSVQVAQSDSGEIEYQASSPDEKALLESASRCGIVFLGEEGDKLRVMCCDRELVYQRLETIEFSSDRRRMSVVVKDHENHIWLVCKGAESTIIPLCSTGPKSETLKHVGDFATRGLRTLAIARRPLHPETWRRMRGELQRARQKVGPARAAAVDTASAALESDLSLLGASGVEDRLQPGVKVTLESLRAAGIKVWVLTGDKVETAINVSRSCGHLKPGTVQFEMVGHTETQQCVESLQAFQERVNMEPLAQYGLVVDGNSLALALLHCPELLRDLCTECTAVLACRLSPLQKCEVVQLMKQAPGKPVTAAVGDGANDVSMIQEAHVGIGIVGKEGRQAVRSSDFAVPRFQHLRRALLVHGHWYYLRVATLVQYFFYKNVAFISAQFFFALNSLFSTQSLYDSFYLTCFNVIYTSLPVLLYGLMEQDKPAETLLDFPENYRLHRDNALLTWSEFFLWTALGAWHALVTYYGPAILINYNSISLLSDGSDAGVWVMGAVVMHCVVFVTNLKLLLASRYWTFFFVGSIALSAFIGFIGVTAAWCALFLNGKTGEMYWSYLVLIYSPAFWLLSIVLVVLCMIPDFAITAWRQMTPPHVLRRLVNLTIRGGCKTGRAFKFIFYKNSGRLSISTTS